MASKSLNLNAVLLVASMGSIQAFAHKREVPSEEPGGKSKTVIDYKLADGTPVQVEAVEEFVLTDAESVAQFNALFDNMPTVKGGYYSYINDSGPTNPTILKTFGPQGLAKIMAQTIQAAHIIMGKGGAEAEQMDALLRAVIDYGAIAQAKIAENKANSLADEIAKLNVSPAQRAALLAKIGGTPAVPTATVEKSEATAGGDGDSDAPKEQLTEENAEPVAAGAENGNGGGGHRRGKNRKN